MYIQGLERFGPMFLFGITIVRKQVLNESVPLADLLTLK